MAPKRIQALLATEIEDGKARAAGRYPTTDSADGEREPNLGTRADCRRTLAEPRRRSVTANGARLLASRVRFEKWEEDRFTALEDIYTESCSLNPSL